MSDIINYLDKLSETDPNIAELLATYKEIFQVFESALKTASLQPESGPESNNTAEVTISFQQSPLSSMEWATDEQKA